MHKKFPSKNASGKLKEFLQKHLKRFLQGFFWDLIKDFTRKHSKIPPGPCTRKGFNGSFIQFFEAFLTEKCFQLFLEIPEGFIEEISLDLFQESLLGFLSENSPGNTPKMPLGVLSLNT